MSHRLRAGGIVVAYAGAMTAEFMAALRQIPMFAGCTDDQLEAIDRVADEVRVDAGEQLTTQGSAGRQAIIILSGTAEVVRDGVVVAERGQGDCVGELSLLANVPRSATLRALEPMKLVVIGAQQFEPLLDEVPELSRHLLSGLAEWVSGVDGIAS